MVERAEAWAAVAVVALLPLVQALLLLAAGYVGARSPRELPPPQCGAWARSG